MKILHLIYSGFGGHGPIATKISNIKLKKINNYILYHGDKKLLREYRKINKNYDFFFSKNLFLFAKIKNFVFLFKKINPDIIISHTNNIFPILVYSLFKKIKIISVQHQSNQIKNIRQYILNLLEFIFSDRVIVLTRLYKNEIIKKFFFIKNLRKKTIIIPNGVEYIKSSTYNIKKDHIIIGMASRFINSKRQDILIRMIKLYYDTYPSIKKKIILSLAGNGETLNNNKILTKNLHIGKYVIFENFLSGKKLLDWYKKIDFYFHASEGEGMSVSILEAMAKKKIIIASNVNGINNLIVNRKNGLLCNNNHLEFFKVLLKIINNQDNYNYLAKNAFADIKNKYSNKIMISKYKKLISSLL